MDDLMRQLMDEAEGLGIEVSDAQATLLVRHLLLVNEKNRVLNLTRIVDLADGVTKHLVDSLLFLKGVGTLRPGDSFVDMGTGAGFPGIPLAIMTEARGLLVDSVGKKVTAVQEFVEALGLDGCEVRAIRIEDLARERPGEFSLVTARAVAQLNVLIEYAAPLLSNGGRLVVSKGQLEGEELANASYAARLCGMRDVSRETFELPHNAGHREIVVYEKVGKPNIKLPRKVGMAKHQPLVPKA